MSRHLSIKLRNNGRRTLLVAATFLLLGQMPSGAIVGGKDSSGEFLNVGEVVGGYAVPWQGSGMTGTLVQSGMAELQGRIVLTAAHGFSSISNRPDEPSNYYERMFVSFKLGGVRTVGLPVKHSLYASGSDADYDLAVVVLETPPAALNSPLRAESVSKGDEAVLVGFGLSDVRRSANLICIWTSPMVLFAFPNGMFGEKGDSGGPYFKNGAVIGVHHGAVDRGSAWPVLTQSDALFCSGNFIRPYKGKRASLSSVTPRWSAAESWGGQVPGSGDIVYLGPNTNLIPTVSEPFEVQVVDATATAKGMLLLGTCMVTPPATPIQPAERPMLQILGAEGLVTGHSAICNVGDPNRGAELKVTKLHNCGTLRIFGGSKANEAIWGLDTRSKVTVTVDCLNEGTIDVHTSFPDAASAREGELKIDGNLKLTPSSKLIATGLAGSGTGGQSHALNVTGRVELGGALVFQGVPGNVVPAGGALRVLRAGSFSGNFSSIQGVSTPSGHQLTVIASDGELKLVSVPELRVTGRPSSTNSQFAFEFNGVTNHSYTVQTTDSLESGSWTDFATFEAASTDRVITVTDIAVSNRPTRFYRVATQ